MTDFPIPPDDQAAIDLLCGSHPELRDRLESVYRIGRATGIIESYSKWTAAMNAERALPIRYIRDWPDPKPQETTAS